MMIYENNSKSIKENASKMVICDGICADEKFVFEKGQTVYATGSGQIRAGVEIVIVGRFSKNGFCKYFGNGIWHSQADLTINSPIKPIL